MQKIKSTLQCSFGFETPKRIKDNSSIYHIIIPLLSSHNKTSEVRLLVLLALIGNTLSKMKWLMVDWSWGCTGPFNYDLGKSGRSLNYQLYYEV